MKKKTAWYAIVLPCIVTVAACGLSIGCIMLGQYIWTVELSANQIGVGVVISIIVLNCIP